MAESLPRPSEPEHDPRACERLVWEMGRQLGETRDEIVRLRMWINTEGRDCPSTASVDAVLEESHRAF